MEITCAPDELVPQFVNPVFPTGVGVLGVYDCPPALSVAGADDTDDVYDGDAEEGEIPEPVIWGGDAGSGAVVGADLGSDLGNCGLESFDNS